MLLFTTTVIIINDKIQSQITHKKFNILFLRVEFCSNIAVSSNDYKQIIIMY